MCAGWRQCRKNAIHLPLPFPSGLSGWRFTMTNPRRVFLGPSQFLGAHNGEREKPGDTHYPPPSGGGCSRTHWIIRDSQSSSEEKLGDAIRPMEFNIHSLLQREISGICLNLESTGRGGNSSFRNNVANVNFKFLYKKRQINIRNRESKNRSQNTILGSRLR